MQYPHVKGYTLSPKLLEVENECYIFSQAVRRMLYFFTLQPHSTTYLKGYPPSNRSKQGKTRLKQTIFTYFTTLSPILPHFYVTYVPLRSFHSLHFILERDIIFWPHLNLSKEARVCDMHMPFVHFVHSLLFWTH